MSSKVISLRRRLFHGGAAGDAGLAGGRHIASNVAIQLTARLITMAIGVVTVSLTARTLSPDGYGVWSGVSSYVGLFGVLTDLGFTTAAMQRMAAHPEREAEWLGALAGARAAMSLAVMVVCAASVPILLSSTGDRQTVGLILTTTIFWGGASALTTVFQSRLRAGMMLTFTVLQAVLWLGAVIALASSKASVAAFAIANATVIGLMALLQIQATRKLAHVAWRAGLSLWRPLARVAIPLGIANVFIIVYYQVDSVLLLQIAGEREAGIYGAAYGFLGPLIFLPAAVMSSFFPVLSAVQRSDPARVRRLVQICLDTMGVIGFPILAGTIALSSQIVHLLYGTKFAGSSSVLEILMIAFVSICFGMVAGLLAPVLNLQWRLAVYSGIGAAANVVLNLLLIPSFGAHGSAWATVVTEILTMVLMLGTCLYKLKLRPSAWKLLGALGMAAAMTGVMVLTRPLGLVPAGAIGVLFYAAGLLLTRTVDMRELRALRAQRS